MRKIGEGLQYTVYRISEDTVRKVPKSREEMVETIKSWESRQESVESLVSKGLDRREKAVGRIVSSDIPERKLFGIKRVEDPEVYQNLMTPVEDFEGKEFPEIVDDYINLLHELWRYGIGDTIYNFTVNNGYRDGKMFQMDFGEIVFDKARVRSEVEEEKWLEKWSYSEDLTQSQKETFKKKMSEKVTASRLEKHWKRKLG
ncbi:hypothetical protein GKQ38_01240 [Candidatus Nanohaloarchaea archaeon]|nr:hypothetical protein GKQ38_01240 [Candidatus Nanohaloarchaea archaeon]